MSRLSLSPDVLKRLQQSAEQYNLSPDELVTRWLDRMNSSDTIAADTLRQPADTPVSDNPAVPYDRIIEAASEGIWVIDLTGQTIFVNPSMAAMLGYSVAEMQQLTLWHVAHDDDRSVIETNLERRRQGQAQQHDFRFIHKDGHDVYVVINTTPLMDSNHTIYAAVGFITDITRRVQAEQQLAASEERFRAISTLTSDYAFSFSVQPDNHIEREWVTGDTLHRITEYTPDEIIAQGGWQALTHPDDLAIVQADLLQLLQQEQRMTTRYRIITKSGQIRHMIGLSQSRADETGEIVQILGSAKDITGEHLAQQELAESEHRFRTLSDNAPVFIWMSDIDGGCSYLNQTWLTFTGRPLAREIGYGWTERVHPGDYDHCLGTYRAAFDKRESFSMEFRLKRHDGVYRWIHNEGVPRFLADGQFTGYIGSCIDITEQRAAQQELERQVSARTQELQTEVERRRQAEAALKRERDLLQRTMQTSPVAIFMVDHQGMIRFASQAAEALLTISHDQIVDRHIRDMEWQLSRPDGTQFAPGETPLENVLLTGQPAYNQPILFTNRTGEQRTLSLNLAPLYSDGQVQEVVVTAEDITQRQEWEQGLQTALEQERQLNRIRSRFVSTVTHEFKTPLAVIQTSCDIIKRTRNRMTCEQVLQRVKRIEAQVKRLSQMVDDIVQINRIDSSDYRVTTQTFNLHQMIYRITEDVSFAYEDTVPVQFELDPRCEFVVLDKTLTHQLIANLVSNAVKYTPEGHHVAIKTTHHETTLTLTIQDDGLGIPDEDIPYLFDDFFRASNVSTLEGTGVGLSIVKRAIDLLQGEIHVVSRVGQGTTIDVTLPLDH